MNRKVHEERLALKKPIECLRIFSKLPPDLKTPYFKFGHPRHPPPLPATLLLSLPSYHLTQTPLHSPSCSSHSVPSLSTHLNPRLQSPLQPHGTGRSYVVDDAGGAVDVDSGAVDVVGGGETGPVPRQRPLHTSVWLQKTPEPWLAHWVPPMLHGTVGSDWFWVAGPV